MQEVDIRFCLTQTKYLNRHNLEPMLLTGHRTILKTMVRYHYNILTMDYKTERNRKEGVRTSLLLFDLIL